MQEMVNEKCTPTERGRRGGLAVSEKPGWMAEIGRRGGVKVSEDREHMSRIGKLGGKARTGKREGHRNAEA